MLYIYIMCVYLAICIYVYIHIWKGIPGPPFPQREALIEGLRHLDSHQLVNLSTTEEVPLDASVLREMPYMSAVAVKAKTGRLGDKNIPAIETKQCVVRIPKGKVERTQNHAGQERPWY